MLKDLEKHCIFSKQSKEERENKLLKSTSLNVTAFSKALGTDVNPSERHFLLKETRWNIDSPLNLTPGDQKIIHTIYSTSGLSWINHTGQYS